MENSNVKEEEGRPPSMASPTTQEIETTQTTQETETTQTTQETETTQVNNSDENEHGAQPPTVEPADLQPNDKTIEAERDRILESLLKAVEEKNDEIFTVKDTKNKKLPDTTPMLPELKSESIRRHRGIIIKNIQEPRSSKTAPSNNAVALTLRKRKRKQERPSRAPMGDGLDEILEAKTWAKPAPLRASSRVEDKKKKETEKFNFPKFAWSWGRKEVGKNFNHLLGKRPRRRSPRKPRDMNTSFPGSFLEKMIAGR